MAQTHTNVWQYDTNAPAPSEADDSVMLTPKQREQRARELCMHRMQEIYADALSSEVSDRAAR